MTTYKLMAQSAVLARARRVRRTAVYAASAASLDNRRATDTTYYFRHANGRAHSWPYQARRIGSAGEMPLQLSFIAARSPSERYLRGSRQDIRRFPAISHYSSCTACFAQLGHGMITLARVFYILMAARYKPARHYAIYWYCQPSVEPAI